MEAGLKLFFFILGAVFAASVGYAMSLASTHDGELAINGLMWALAAYSIAVVALAVLSASWKQRKRR